AWVGHSLSVWDCWPRDRSSSPLAPPDFRSGPPHHPQGPQRSEWASGVEAPAGAPPPATSLRGGSGSGRLCTMDRSRCPVVERLMQPFVVVEGEILAEALVGLAWTRIVL